MSRDNPWTKHRQSFWQEKTGRASLPLWIRVYALAYGGHHRNGHTPFGPGEVALATTVVVDHETGEIRRPAPAEVSRAIATAIRHGFLSPMSHARCLVVPPHGIEGGMVGDPNEVCGLHDQSKNRRKFDEISQTVCLNQSNNNALTSGNVTRLYDSSTPLTAATNLRRPGIAS